MKPRMVPAGRDVQLQVEVDGEEWTSVPDLGDYSPDDKCYTVTVNDDGSTTVTFGDGVHGSRPDTGTSAIKATYRSGQHYTSVLLQQGTVTMDRDWDEAGVTYAGVYRGIVDGNADPLGRLRLFIRVPDVLGNQQLWAEASLPVGEKNLPSQGEGVWVAFESGDPQRPVWIGTHPD